LLVAQSHNGLTKICNHFVACRCAEALVSVHLSRTKMELISFTERRAASGRARETRIKSGAFNDLLRPAKVRRELPACAREATMYRQPDPEFVRLAERLKATRFQPLGRASMRRRLVDLFR